MKTKVAKIENKVKMKLWGTHWIVTPMIVIVLILWITGNGDALKEGRFWYVLIIGLFGSLIRISKIPYIPIIIALGLTFLMGFSNFDARDAIFLSTFFMVVSIIYDHYYLREVSKNSTISKAEKQEYLDLIHEEINNAISHMYEKREYCNLKSGKLAKSLEHEEKEFEEAKKFSGDTRNFEKSIQRKKIDIQEIKDLLKKNEDTEKELKSAMDSLCLEQKTMRLA